MSYLKLLNAKRKSGKQPSMQPMHLSKQQKSWADQGQCIQCGTRNVVRNSFICQPCQAKETIGDIREEISALRQKILGRSSK